MNERSVRHAQAPADARDRPPGVSIRSDHAATDFLRRNQAVAAALDADTVYVQPQYAGSRAVLSHEFAHIAQLRSGLAATRESAEAAAERVAAGTSAVAGGAAPAPMFQSITLPTEVFTNASPMPPPGGTDLEGNALGVGAGGRRYLLAPPRGWGQSAHGYKPQLLPPNPLLTYLTLFARIVAVHQAQHNIAERLKAAHDMKYWFARVYEYVTENEINAILAQRYMYPHMKMQEVIGFQNTYAANLDAWERGARDRVETNWRIAFASAESSAMSGSVMGWDVKNALLPSMQAHIRFDLPRAIAAAYVENYSGIPGTTIDDFRPDFEAMAPVFDAAQNEIEPEMTSWHDRNAWFLGRVGSFRWIPFGGSGSHFWGSIFDQIFDVARERDETWVKATMITALMGLPNVTQRDVERVVEFGQPTSALNIGGFVSSERFSSTAVRDYDWLHQPNASGFTSPDMSPAEKAEQIDALVSQWWVSGGDVAQIEHILATVRSEADMATIRARVESRVVHELSGGDYVRVWAALHRTFP